jgi:hypothetical protein
MSHMRCTRALLIAIVVAVAALTPRSVGENASRACPGRVSCVGVRLPAPITILPRRALGAVTLRIGRDGRVRRIPEAPSPFPRNAAWFLGSAMILVSSRAVAFQHDHKLYVARLGGTERPVARREQPLGWTTGGLYTYRYQGRQLLLRDDTGALMKVIGRRPLGSDYQVANGSLYFISRGVLISARGTHVRRLASLSRLGLSARPSLAPLGRLVELQDDHRVVVVRPDGSVFAWTRLPRSHGQAESVSSSLVVAPHASAVAFTAASGPTGGRDAAGRTHDTETVYLLRSGAHRPTPLHTERTSFGCGRWAGLEWHGRWLLYSSTVGNLAVIDTTGAHPAVELGSLVRTLSGMRDGFSAHWSDQPPGL